MKGSNKNRVLLDNSRVRYHKPKDDHYEGLSNMAVGLIPHIHLSLSGALVLLKLRDTLIAPVI